MIDDDIYLFNPKTNEVFKNVGLRFFALNSKDEVEIWSLEETTNIETINLFRKKKRIFVEHELSLF